MASAVQQGLVRPADLAAVAVDRLLKVDRDVS